MYPFCTVLEELAGQLAAPVVTKETLAALDHELRAMRVAADRRDLPQQVLHDVRYHKAIVEAAGNALLTRTWSTIPLLAALRAKDLRVRARHSASTLLAPECCPAWAAPTLRPVTEDW